MQKRTIIILTIISTILSLITIFLSYFGIIRYLSLHVKSSEKFIEKYSKLPKVSDNSRVVISFTTTPEKIKKIKPMINSILDQTVKVDFIEIVIPNSEKTYDIPKYIKDVAMVLPSGKDYGDGTKIIPVLLREQESDTVIIALNDNMVYGQDYIYSIIEESRKNPEKMIIDNKNSTMLVKPEFFDSDVINRNKKKYDLKWMIKKSKGTKVLNYSENYKIIGF